MIGIGVVVRCRLIGCAASAGDVGCTAGCLGSGVVSGERLAAIGREHGWLP